MTGWLMRRVGTYSGGRQAIVLSCQPLNSHLQRVCTLYFGILESRIPLKVHITVSLCLIMDLYYVDGFHSRL